MPVCTPANWPLRIEEYGDGKEDVVVRKALAPFAPPRFARPLARVVESLASTLTELALDVDLVRGRFVAPVAALTRLRRLHLIVAVSSSRGRRRGRAFSRDSFADLGTLVSGLAALEEFKLTRTPPEARGFIGYLSDKTVILDLRSASLRCVDLREACHVRLFVAGCPNLLDLYVKDGHDGSGVRRTLDGITVIDDEERRQRGGGYLPDSERQGTTVSAADGDWCPLPQTDLFLQPWGFADVPYRSRVSLPDTCSVHFCP